MYYDIYDQQVTEVQGSSNYEVLGQLAYKFQKKFSVTVVPNNFYVYQW